jgi:hypothetical protein
MAAHPAWERPSAGLFVGPAAWFLNTQVNYALTPWVCAHQIRIIPAVALALAALSLGGGFLSWRACRAAGTTPAERFLAAIGVAMALLFAAVILVQGAAGLVFHGCER